MMPAFFYGRKEMSKEPVVIRRPRQSGQTVIEKMLIRLISDMNQGKVTLVLQDGAVIQVNREETVRLA